MRPDARLLHVRPDAHFSLVLGKGSENRSGLDGSDLRACEKCVRMLVSFTYAPTRISHWFMAAGTEPRESVKFR